MSALAQAPIGELLRRRWRDPAAWMTAADVSAILLALSLPWSTSLVGIFGVVTVIAMLPTIDLGDYVQSLKRPICMAPVALFVLALVGTLWSDAAWGVRFHSVAPAAKLLVLPLLLQHFQRSQRGMWVFAAFLVSCTALMLLSWVVAYIPSLTLKAKAVASNGIFVKNYIDQSQEFTLCAVVLAYPIVAALRERKIAAALLFAALGLSFLANMLFVIVSRTALVTVPLMFAVFGLLHLRWRTAAMILVGLAIALVVAWKVSPQLEATVSKFNSEYQGYSQYGRATSIGERLEYYRKSLIFFAEAPVIGNGTGSIRGLFERSVEGAEGLASAEIVSNPHNQTLNVAIQWGTIGIVTLYAMWLAHLLLFRGEGMANWIGLLVVVQNIFTSVFNSHIFDFHEGWMYVLGVGVAGGMVLKSRGTESAKASDAS